MEFFYVFIFLLLLIINSMSETLSVNLCEKNGKLRPTFAEIFGQKWDNEKLECENENESVQNANYHQSDQNQLSLSNPIHNDQIEQFKDQQKREIVHKFHAIKEGIKKRRKYSSKNWNKIDQKIAEKLGISRKKIYKWKKELKINKKKFYVKKRSEFIERIDEIKRMSKKGKQKQIANELGIGQKTFSKWKKEFGIKMSKSTNAYSNEEKTNKMNIYYEMKNENLLLSDKEIGALLKISLVTLSKWKKETNS